MLLDGSLEIAAIERVGEGTDIAGDHTRVQTHGIRAGEHRLADRAAEGVQQLVQRMSRARLRRVGPEEQQELVATATLLTGGRQHRKQRQSSAVVAVRAENRVVARPRQRE